MKLLIISHTEHYKRPDGTIVGLASTVKEINFLAERFDKIYHIAMFHRGEAPSNTLAYRSDKIEFISIPAFGGPRLSDKLSILWYAPKVLFTVHKYLKRVDRFQFRAPTAIGVYVIPFLTRFTSKKGWYKYAGNWVQEHPPKSYAIQRRKLKKQSRPVTINGKWEGQPDHCISFENPCLTDEDVVKGKHVMSNKQLDEKRTFCFVGRLEDEKGVKLLIEAFLALTDVEKEKVKEVVLVGSGKKRKEYETMTQNQNVHFTYTGFLSKDEVNKVYKSSHFFVLPSYSEGFPKVIAEAMNFGCLPIVSDVSSIGQYVKDKENGLLINPLTSNELKSCISNALSLSNADYKNFLSYNKTLVDKFTYHWYMKRLFDEVI